ncbi:hypothetical protein SVAN01_03570 [Stagonosporopsis vannaccii]|nr:hypothetical protein SVAN01_03570 [Stagonosporopsis vannaccii]
MPTGPTRRERRRADRRNNGKITSPLPKFAPISVAQFGSLSPPIFMSAAPIVRTVMCVVLIQTSFIQSQVYSFKMWKELLEEAKPEPAAPDYDQHQSKIACLDVMISLHRTHVHQLKTLQLDHAKHIIMWGFECSKAEEDWDEAACAFEERLHELLEDEQAFSFEKERVVLSQMLNKFRENFAEGVVITDKETAVTLEEMGYVAVESAVGGV